jgi:hypothetical protein
MEHTTEIIELQELNDGMIAYRFRCCGDPKTDSYQTLSVTLDDETHDATVERHHQRIRELHAAKLSALERGQRLLKHA